MDDLDVWGGEEEQGCAKLLGKLACQVEGDASEVSVAQQLVEIVRQQLEDKTEMVLVHETTLHPNYEQTGKFNGRHE